MRTRIENAVSRFSLHVRADRRARVGISIGTVTYGSIGETLDQLLIVADQAMYQVKPTHKLEQAQTSVPTETVPPPQAGCPPWGPGSDLGRAEPHLKLRQLAAPAPLNGQPASAGILNTFLTFASRIAFNR